MFSFTNIIRKEVPIFVITIAAILVSLPMLVPGFYTVHDDQQIARLYLFDKAIKGGQFPPRWVGELGFGFGYPLFIFYPPLVYFLAEIYHVLGLGLIDSVKLVFFSSILFSAFAMYILVKELWGKLEALVAALFYMFLPYRALDVYVRGAMSESFSFVFLPLIIWSFYKLRISNEKKYIYTSSVFLALLMITHNLIFLPFMLILPWFLTFLTIQKNNNTLKFIKYFLKSFILAFGLSAFFWLPAIIEKKYTIVDSLLLINLASYNIHFVYPIQLWNWAWGYGGSASGLTDGISFKIGKLHILLSLASVIISLAYMLLKSQNQKVKQISFITFVFFLLFLFSAFMTTYFSKPLWDILTPLRYLQFPWRFLVFTGLFSSILAGAFIYFLKLPVLKLAAALIITSLILFTNVKLFKPQTYRPDLTDESATKSEILRWDVSNSSFEYIPKGVPLYIGGLNTNLVDIQKKDTEHSLIEASSNMAKINILSYSPSKSEFTVSAPEPVKITAGIFNFPGWIVSVNSQMVSVDDQNRLKLITFNVPKGDNRVKIEFTNTPVRSLANWISLGAIVLMLILLFNKWKIRQF